MYTNIHIFWEMLNRVVVGLFRSKMEVKRSKSVCRGILLFSLFNPLFYIWMMRRESKNIPAKFQNCPTFLAWFFSQKSDGQQRSKEDFYLRSTWWAQVLKPSVLLSWSTVACSRTWPRAAHSSIANFAKRQHPGITSNFSDFRCFFELFCLTISGVAVRPFF